MNPEALTITLAIVLIVTPIALNVIAWRKLVRFVVDPARAHWRKPVAYAGVISNSLVIVLPLFAFIKSFILGHQTGVTGDEFPNWPLYLEITLLLAVISVVAGALSPKGIRLPLILGNLLWVVTLLMIGGGV